MGLRMLNGIPKLIQQAEANEFLDLVQQHNADLSGWRNHARLPQSESNILASLSHNTLVKLTYAHICQDGRAYPPLIKAAIEELKEQKVGPQTTQYREMLERDARYRYEQELKRKYSNAQATPPPPAPAAPHQTQSVSHSNGHTRTETYDPSTGRRTIHGELTRPTATTGQPSNAPAPSPYTNRYDAPPREKKETPVSAPSSTGYASGSSESKVAPAANTPARSSPTTIPHRAEEQQSTRLQNLMREIGMENTGTGMREGLSGLSKLGWETWLEERAAKLSERRMRTRSQIAQQMGSLIDARSNLSATSHRADLQDILQAYDLQEAQRDPRSLRKVQPAAPLPAQASTPLPMPQTKALPSASSTPAITDEKIDALAYAALLGFQNEGWGEDEWAAFVEELAKRYPENVVREVHRRVGEMAQELG